VLTTLAVAAAAVGTAVPAATAAPPPVQVVAKGLDDPFGLHFDSGRFYVAENASGEISSFGGDGRVATLVSGLKSPAGVDVARGRLLALTGGSEVPDANSAGTATLFSGYRFGSPVRALADLQAYELAHNPDGQLQFGADGKPVDALSNPFSVLAGRGAGHPFAYLADGGANDVLAVDGRGTLSTFFVPPTVTTGACGQQPENAPGTFGCDAVPTGLALGPHNTLYVSALTSEIPGEGRVYVVDATTGHLQRTLTGFSAPTGVAVDGHGTVYVSELLEGAPEGDGPPPAGFDPSTVGQIVKVDRHGSRSTAQVTMPIGLEWHDGHLYSTAWSVAKQFLMQDHAGQVVRVDDAAFTSAE
jgi:hypothetical protein